MDNIIIPDFQPVAFPAPLWLLKTMLVLGFFSHVIPMNVTLTGGLVSGAYLFSGMGRGGDRAARLGRALSYTLPVFVSLAITQGVLPLLFIQLVYGPLFYTSSILIAVPWIMVLVYLITGYYAYYVFKYRNKQLGSRAPWVLFAASIFFLAIAFTFVNNITLMMTPEKWPAIVNGGGVDGLYLNWSEPQLVPRYLHFLLAAFAVTALAIGGFGLYWHRNEPEYGQWVIQQGAGLYLGVTLLQFGVGTWFLLSLPVEHILNYIGGDLWGTLAFAGAMAFDLLALWLMFRAWRTGRPGVFKLGMACALVVVLMMVTMRQLLREYEVSAVFHPETVPVDTQWNLLIMFAVTLLILLAYLAWLARIILNAFDSREIGISGKTAFERRPGS